MVIFQFANCKRLPEGKHYCFPSTKPFLTHHYHHQPFYGFPYPAARDSSDPQVGTTRPRGLMVGRFNRALMGRISLKRRKLPRDREIHGVRCGIENGDFIHFM